MNIVKSEKFLNKFKELETAVRETMGAPRVNQSPVMMYEERLAETNADEANYLTHLRQKRNIITHNHKFAKKIVCTDEEVEFLQLCVNNVYAIGGTIKELYTPAKNLAVVTFSQTVADINDAIAKSKKFTGYVYVLSDDKKECYKVSTKAIFEFLATKPKANTKVSKLITTQIDKIDYAGLDVNTPRKGLKLITSETPVFRSGKFVGILFEDGMFNNLATPIF